MHCFYSGGAIISMPPLFENIPTVSEFPLMQSSDKADEKHLPS